MKPKIGDTLQVIRKAKGMNQKELADKVGISSKHLSELENGHKEPRYDLLCKLLDALGAKILITCEIPYTKTESGIENVSIPLHITR